METMERVQRIASFLKFLHDVNRQSKASLIRADAEEVRAIRAAVEEHYLDDQGKPAMYQSIESAFYDDARLTVTLWNCFDEYSTGDLQGFQSMLDLELDGLTGDRHPRKVFDRSPFGIAALIVATITIWMTVFQTYSGEDLSNFLELIRFNSIAGLIWIVGLFVVVWYILKTHRNNRQVAFLASLRRALHVYLGKTN